jgi:hypothetical protein
MYKGRTIRVAGPQDDQKTGAHIEHARTHLFVRERVRDAARQALPPHARRPTKGEGRWSGSLRLGL